MSGQTGRGGDAIRETNWRSPYRSGASENDAFFNPSKETAQRLGAQAPRTYQRPERRGGAAGPSTRTPGRYIHEATVAFKDLLRETKAEVNSAFDSMAGAAQQIARRDEQLDQQNRQIQNLSRQLEAVMREVHSIKTPQNTMLPFGDTTVAPNPAVTPDTQNRPSTAGDVFTSPPPASSRGPHRFSPTDFEKRPLPELLGSCFTKVEAAVRRFPINNLARAEESHSRRQIIILLQQHLGHQKLAYDIFNNDNERHWAAVAMISHSIVDFIFKEHILGGFQSFPTGGYMKARKQEQEAMQYQHAKADDFAYRHSLAVERAHWAAAVVKLPGFWKWVQSMTAHHTNVIVGHFDILFPPQCLGLMANELYKAVDEAMRIAIRMLQEPTFPEITFPPAGTPWNSNFHIHRNPGLIGQVLGDDKPPFCVRIACGPLIKSKSFEKGTVETTTLHKAEVTVVDRSLYVKASRRRY